MLLRKLRYSQMNVYNRLYEATFWKYLLEVMLCDGGEFLEGGWLLEGG